MDLVGPAGLWWVRGPRVGARLSRGLAFSAADGHFLLGVPGVAAVAPAGLALLGFVAGALTLGYERVFSETVWIVLVAAAAGCLATGLGLAFTAGFALGDFCVGQRTWTMTSLFADGPLEEGLLLEAKYVSNPGASPFVEGSSVPPMVRDKIVTKVDDEFRRYGEVIRDPATKPRLLEVVVNSEEARPFFEGLLRKYQIPGRVVVVP